MKLIEAKNLVFSYDNKNNALDGVSFALEEGKYYSLIGPNGSGKSTVARILVGLLKTKEGSLKAFDLDYNRENIKAIRNRIAIVFQNPDNQFIGSTVRDDIAFGLENHEVPQNEMDDIILKYLKEVDMLDYLDKEPGMLSGGQKQRVAIAGVLSMHPDIIIFDEATAMLDPKGKADVYKTIARLKENNPKITLISITHDIEEAFNSDEILVLSKGKLIYQLPPKELLSKGDELEAIGLDIPFIYKLKNELNKNGIEVKDTTSLEGLVNDICK